MSNGGSDQATTIERIERARLQALVAADIPTCEQLHASDYELITPGGGRVSRGEYLGMIASGEIRYSVFETSGEVRLRLSETAAIVRYQARIVGEFSGARDEGLFWHTDSYEFRDGRWQAVWSQATRIRT
ncbi:MAG TPA: nuclear transport factor 2 family protein [Methylomirabilota bacterium]|nr:nuclear transport factor 2 family protein [Methylomirabilota bacterium]